DRFDEPQPLRRRIRSRDEGYGERDEDDLYRPRRAPARAAIPERAASRDDWDSRSDRREAPPAGAAGRYRAGSAPTDGPGREFGSRRQDRDETRRGSRPAAASEPMPRSSRRPGPSDRPEGTPYRPQGSQVSAATSTASDPGVSDAEFRPVPPSSRNNGPSSTGPSSPGPRDNSSRFDD
ncbi:MAG: hypothetical protein ACO3FK_04720, partial [Vulcanococcus sp.]